MPHKASVANVQHKNSIIILWLKNDSNEQQNTLAVKMSRTF